MRGDEREQLTIDGRTVEISHPHKVLFPKPGHTKLDLVRYYLAVADGALRGAGGRPNMLVRYPNGVDSDFFYQKRAPKTRPEWIEVVELKFPSGRSAEEVVPRHAAALAWLANLGCLELHPHPVRAEDLDHPDELRIDLDPVRGVEWPQIRAVARIVHEVLDELKLTGWPKTSGKRGLHVYVRIEPRYTFDELRRAALALAREVERRAPKLASSQWWKEERHGVFIDYNQNAKDRTVAAAYSVRPTERATVSAPLTWAEVDTAEPQDFTLVSMPPRFKKVGDPHAAIDAHAAPLEPLLALSESQGLGDAPWPPHYRKQHGEPPRVRPSKAKKKTKVKRTPWAAEVTKRAAAAAAEAQRAGGKTAGGVAEQLQRGAANRAKRGAAAAAKRAAAGKAKGGAHGATRSGAATQSGAATPTKTAVAATAKPTKTTLAASAETRATATPQGSSASKRRPRRPLIEIGRAKREQDALAGFDRWKKRHREAAKHLEPADVLVDAMRGRYSTWTRIRVNLEHVPADLRPAQEPLDPNENTRSSS